MMSFLDFMGAFGIYVTAFIFCYVIHVFESGRNKFP
jgi:hypothetical protein